MPPRNDERTNMIKPKVLVFSGYGLNCEEETKYAFEQAGAIGEILHINDIIEKPSVLKNYQIFAMPGGFSYADDTGSGNAYAKKIQNHLSEELQSFIKRDILGIGICNGFQILANLGLFGKVALLPNTNARYTTRWVDLEFQKNKSPWLKNIKNLSLPIAHGEGRFYADSSELKKLESNNQIDAKYVCGEICEAQSLDANPNGSTDDIAGVINSSGRILGLMPHPERAIAFTQHPHWTYLKEKYLREGKTPPKFGPSLQILKNAVEYFK